MTPVSADYRSDGDQRFARRASFISKRCVRVLRLRWLFGPRAKLAAQFPARILSHLIANDGFRGDLQESLPNPFFSNTTGGVAASLTCKRKMSGRE
jgi:hypothetical protein